MSVQSTILSRSCRIAGFSVTDYRDDLAKLIAATIGTPITDPALELELDDEF